MALTVYNRLLVWCLGSILAENIKCLKDLDAYEDTISMTKINKIIDKIVEERNASKKEKNGIIQ